MKLGGSVLGLVLRVLGASDSGMLLMSMLAGSFKKGAPSHSSHRVTLGFKEPQTLLGGSCDLVSQVIRPLSGFISS